MVQYLLLRRLWLFATAFYFPGVVFSPASGAMLFNVLSNGLPEKRINLLVFSEGYQASEQDKFLVDATNAINNLLLNQPFFEYRSYFNGFAIFVASVDSGSDHPSSNVWKTTYFNSSFDTLGRSDLLSIPPNNFDNDAAHGEQKATSLANDMFPYFNVPMMLVNDLAYGGSAGQMAVISVHPNSRQILAHEIGHSFAGLGDEYETPAPYPDIEEPNTTRETNRSLIKWNAWILPETPIPTPDTFAYAGKVGLFEGAHYHTTGWFRPERNCKMRTLTAVFCKVCTETLVKTIYLTVEPIEQTFPGNSSVTVSNALQEFSVLPLKPRTHELDVAWFVNGSSIVGQTNVNFRWNPAEWPPGVYTLNAVATDKTSLVKADPERALQDEAGWMVTVIGSHQAPISLSSPVISGESFQFRVINPPIAYQVEGSSNLFDWFPISTNSGTSSNLNSYLTNLPQHFFRVKQN